MSSRNSYGRSTLHYMFYHIILYDINVISDYTTSYDVIIYCLLVYGRSIRRKMS